MSKRFITYYVRDGEMREREACVALFFPTPERAAAFHLKESEGRLEAAHKEVDAAERQLERARELAAKYPA